MSTNLTGESFLDVVHRSGLLTPDRTQTLLQELKDEGIDLDSPQAVADALIKRGELTSWQADKLLVGKHRGFFLGSYRLLKMLGRGGMGAVYLAQHEMMRRRCAIKVLPTKRANDQSSVLERFYIEAQAVASLDHPNIVRAYDVNKDVQGNSEIHYLVMEYVEGKDIQALVSSQGVMDYVAAANFIRQAACGLTHAHENGLIHRDIKPANLLVDLKGVVKILDLGLARFFDDEDVASLTVAHDETVLGTADYLAPEQALNSHNVDTRADIYGLGCTFYFMLTGHPPFRDGTVAQRLLAHQLKAPKPIKDDRPDVPRDLLAIIDKMMAKKPDSRFQKAAEVASALEQWICDNASEDFRSKHPQLQSGAPAMPQARNEPTRGASDAYTDTDFELAPLDDDEPKKKKEPQQPAAASSQPSDSEKPATTPAAAAVELPPLESLAAMDDLASMENLEGLPEFTSSDPLAADFPAMSGPSVGESSVHSALSMTPQSGPASSSGRLGRLAGQSGIGSGIGSGMRQPAPQAAASEGRPLWLMIVIGVGAAAPVVLLLLFLFSWLSSPADSGGISEVIPVTLNGDSNTVDDSSGTSRAPTNQTGNGEDKSTNNTQPNQQQPNGAAATQNQNGTSTNNGQSQSPTKKPANNTAKKKPQPKPPAESDVGKTPAVTPVEPQPPPEPTPSNVADPTKTPTPPPPVEPVEPTLSPEDRNRQLLAQVKEVTIKLTSIDKNRQSKLNLRVERTAQEVLERLGWKVVEAAPAELAVSFSAKEVGDAIEMTMKAELKARDEKSQLVTLISHEASVGQVNTQMMARMRGEIHPAVQLGIADFYNGLSTKTRLALAQSGGGAK